MASQLVRKAPHTSINADQFTVGIMVDNAMDLIPKPPMSEESARDYFDVAMEDALAHGLTSIHDADSRPEAVSLFKK
jgi:predicted amidohydrolase YtcJ